MNKVSVFCCLFIFSFGAMAQDSLKTKRREIGLHIKGDIFAPIAFYPFQTNVLTGVMLFR
jgi:hypothetical protein